MKQDELREILDHFDAKAAETLRHFDEKSEETCRHMEVLADSLRSDIRLVAEGVVAASERMDRFQEEMRREFSEVKAMVKFSYAELDRRVSHLEATVGDLSERMHRLEERLP